MAEIKKPLVVVQGPVATRSGYGDHSRDLVRSLISLDKYDIRIVSMRWGTTPMNGLNPKNDNDKQIIDRIGLPIDRTPDVFIQITVPNEFERRGTYNIGITAGIETTVAPIDWIHGCNKMDLIIVPSEFSKDVLLKTTYVEKNNQTGQIVNNFKIIKPIEVLFEGFNNETFGADTIPHVNELDSIKEDFAFLITGHWLQGELGHDRKDIGMTIKSFCHAFGNEKQKPALVLKTSSAGFSVRDREDMAGKIEQLTKEFGDKCPSIYLLHGDLTETEMHGLYEHPKVKAMVSFTHGEGFGRPLLEFSLTGKPVIASNWSGHLDFLKSGAVLLDGELKEVHPSAQNQFILKGSQWFYVNYSNAINKLKDIYKNYDKYKVESYQLGKQNTQNFSLEKMTKGFDTILTQYVPTIKQFIPLNLPTLTKINESNTSL
jgi:glycosyltransferase involved in cell wall biosynthesis